MKQWGTIVVVLIIGLGAGRAVGDAVWVGTADTNFMNTANWNPVEVPAGNMTVADGSPHDPIYAYTGASYVGVASLSVSSGGHLTVTAGELRPNGAAYWNGAVTVSGGLLNVRNNIYIGHGGGAGVVTMTGGRLICKAIMTLGFGAGADGSLNVWGGTVDMGSGAPRVAYNGGNGRISVKNDGVAYCAGDATASFQGLVTAGRLTTEIGWEIVIDYRAGENRTYLTARRALYATEPQPAAGQTTDPDHTTLSWYPGQNAVRHEVYLGTSSAAVAAAAKSAGDVDGNGIVEIADVSELAIQWLAAPADPCPDLDGSGIVDLPDLAGISADWQAVADPVYRGATGSPTWNPGSLSPGTTYFWRVDSVACDNIEPGRVWNFQTASPPVVAFPGAEGFGAQANGGRGGDVYTVTNLNSSGEGSLRYGVETAPAAGRTIVFAVSGYIPISYNSDTGNQTVRIVQNNITIAGQTAPGDGIGLKDGRILVTGDHAVIRHLRVRHGKGGAAGDCVNVESSAEHTILDHVSLMFSTDENISFFNSAVNNFTMQYCTSSWGMERHNAGGLWDLENGTCHHSLWAHHRTRNPKARPYGLLEWINNVTFHWRGEGFIMGDSETPAGWYANVIGCYFLSIPDYGFGLKSKAFSKALIDRNGNPNFYLYLNDCLHDADGDGRLNGTDKGYGIVDGQPYSPAEGAAPGSVRYVPLSAPRPGAATAVTTDDPLTAYKKVLSSAGALRLDAAYPGPLRDELDDLLIESVENQQSILVAKDSPVTSDPEEPPSNGEQHLADAYGISNNGFGTLNSSAYPTDSDGDGMPDFWERAVGSDHAVQNHNQLVPPNAYVSLGYTLLEEYLHFRAIPHAVIARRTASEPSSLSVDLRRYTRGFNVAPVVFALSDVRNGSAVIQLDGFTVVFEPALDFSGRARFNFTVTDGDGSTWTQTLAVLAQLPPPPAVPSGLLAQGANAQVRLEWDDNAETSLAGYHVYRTTTSGSAYVKVTASPVATSAYTDTDVTNGTLYHYVVTAVDTAMSESGATGEVTARPVASGTSAILQENTVGFCGVDGLIENNNAGFTADGFANTDNAAGNGVDWAVQVASAGTCTLTWRYANGGGSDRPGVLQVNGAAAGASISFPETANWATWSTVSRTVSLAAGLNHLRLEATGTSGLGNIDFIEIAGVNVTPTNCD